MTEVGAGLRTFTSADRPYVEPFPLDSRPPRGAGTVLVPWPNRTAGGRWTWKVPPQQLALNEPAAGNAIHGLLRYTFYDVVDRAADAITLAARVAPQPGWPVPLATQVRYAVAADGLTVTHTVSNIGAGRRAVRRRRPPLRPRRRHAPPTTAHCSSPRRRPCRSSSGLPDRPGPAGRGRRRLPRRPPAQGPDAGPRASAAACPAAGDELVRHRLLGPDGGVELWADPDFRWVQVFTPATTPAAAAPSPSSR